VLNCAQVVAQGQNPGRLDSGKNSFQIDHP
jgi:hypothetical protein